MMTDRRGFLSAGALTAAAGSFALAAHAAPAHAARSVTDFGVEPNTDRDQTDALQKAIDELSKAGQAVALPAGLISVTRLTLPYSCAILGVPGMSFLRVRQISGRSGQRGMATLSGIFFTQHPGSGSEALLSAPDTLLFLRDCAFEGKGRTALELGAPEAGLHSVRFSGWEGAALVSASQKLLVESCAFHACGMGLETAPSARTSVVNSHFENCGVGAAVSGTGLINGNILLGARQFGLKLGSAKGDGHIVAQGNLIRDCRIGVGVSSSGDDIMVSLNRITGSKEGAIRAFDGDKLVGPDLARQSAEAYLNLMVAGNVAR